MTVSRLVGPSAGAAGLSIWTCFLPRTGLSTPATATTLVVETHCQVVQLACQHIRATNRAMSDQSTSNLSSPLVPSRFSALIWSCLDADLTKSAVFYAERYFSMYPGSHDARHLYATALLRAGQPHSAHYTVCMPIGTRCSGCLELKAQCCTALGRHRQAREALEACLHDPKYSPTRAS